MKAIVILFFVAVACAEQYDSNNDNFDVEKLLSSPASVKEMVNCFIDKGDCDEVGRDFKKDLPEAVQLACAKCTQAQKHLVKRFFEELKKTYPEDYQLVQNKFDPSKKYLGPLETAVANA